MSRDDDQRADASSRARLPWWWLRESECVALGIGAGAERSDIGVVFGDAAAGIRIEIVARREDASASVRDVSIRLWTRAQDRRARAIVAAAARLIAARVGTGFDPADPTLPLQDRKRGDDARRGSEPRSTIIDLPSVCERACTFCEISRKPIALRRPRGDDADVARRIATATGPILFTGDDALSHSRIVDLVAAAAEGGREVSVIGPPRRALTAALAGPLAAAGLRRFQTAILGADAVTHDAIAGLPGAYSTLEEASAAMVGAGIVVELITPLVRAVLPALRAIAERANAMTSEPLTLMPYAPDVVVGLHFDHVVARWDDMKRALSTLGDTRVRVDGVPLCVLPMSLRRHGGGRLERTDEELRIIYPEQTCAACSARDRCSGVAATALRAVGSEGLGPIE